MSSLPGLDRRRHMLRVLGNQLDAAGGPHRIEEPDGVPVLDLKEFDRDLGRLWAFPAREGGWFYRWDRGDNDPVVMAHAQAILVNDDQTTAVEADLRQPADITDHPDLRALIDLDEPVAVVVTLLLHFVTDEENPAGIVAAFREAMAPGSYLVVCHGTTDRRPEAMEKIERLYDQASSPVTMRSSEQIRALLDGFELVDPGLVFMSEWRPDDPTQAEERAWAGLVAVGRKTG